MLSRKIWVRYRALETMKTACNADPRNWLSDAERREFARFRDEGRLQQWQAGRFLVKQLLNEQLVPGSTPWRDVEILSRDEDGRAVRPWVRIHGKPRSWCVSISHTQRGVLAAVSLSPGIQVGVDLAEREELNPQSLVFWFSAGEREQLREADARQTAVCWAVKEAVYKAINTGESFVPKKFEVFPQSWETYDCRHDGASLKEPFPHYGLGRRRPRRGDGHCLFHSVGPQRASSKWGEESYRTVGTH